MSALGELGSLRGKKPAGQKPDRGGGAGKANKKDNKAGYCSCCRGCRAGRDHDRADDRLAVPVVHQLQPDPGAEVDRAGELHPDAVTTRGCTTRCG